MNRLINLIALLMILNIFMYLGVNFARSAEGNSLNTNYNFHFQGDLIDTYLQGSETLDNMTESLKNNWTDYNIKLSSNISTMPNEQGGISTGIGGISFLDSLKIVYATIKTLGNVIQSPLTLFFNFHMPVFIGLMIGIPYFIILFFCMIALIRGVGD